MTYMKNVKEINQFLNDWTTALGTTPKKPPSVDMELISRYRTRTNKKFCKRGKQRQKATGNRNKKMAIKDTR